MTRHRIVLAVGVFSAGFYLVVGMWAFLAPQSFYDVVAPFPPYNRHFLHDAGSFQAGLGVGLALMLFARSAVVAVLGGVATANVLHAASHFIDRDLGGRATDPWSLSLFAAVVVAALVAATRDRSDEAR